MFNKKIFIFPNYAFQFSNNDILLEASHELLIKPLLKSKFNVTLIGVLDEHSKLGNYKPAYSKRISFIFLNKLKIQKGSIRLILNYLLIFLRSFKIIRKSTINYIFLPGNIGIIISLLSLLLKQPYAIYYRGDWFVKTPRIFRNFKKIIFKNAKFIIYVGTMPDKTIEMLNANCEMVIPMLSFPIRLYKKDLDITLKKGFSVLFIGEMNTEKGVYELFSSVRNLNNKGIDDINLTFVGNGKELNNLKLLISDYGLQNKISLLGKITDPEKLINLYNTHTIFCLPSYSEGFPRVLIEAMIFGLPIISTKVGKIETFFKNNQNGILINPMDAYDLESKIELLYNDEDFRTMLGSNAFHSIKSFVQKWQSLTHGDQVVNWIKKFNF